MKLVTELVKQDTVTDEDIKSSAYGIANHAGDGLNTEELNKLRTMRTRLQAIEQAERDSRKARREWGAVKADCGHYTTEVMSASRGTSCPNCYDRMSD